MKCINCNSADTVVTDTRASKNGDCINRRRKCISCGTRFPTTERIELPDMIVVKRNGAKERFQRNKIYNSFLLALSKNTTNDARFDQVIRASSEVEAALVRSGQSVVSSSVIGEMVMEKLKDIDQIAYLRFALVYKPYSNLSEIRDTLDNLEQSNASGISDQDSTESETSTAGSI